MHRAGWCAGCGESQIELVLPPRGCFPKRWTTQQAAERGLRWGSPQPELQRGGEKVGNWPGQRSRLPLSPVGGDEGI